jgi:phosphoserine aminotransferase
MKREHQAYNFNAGPTALPLEVLQKAQAELLDFKQSGMSIMEMSHRGGIYEEIHNNAISLLKELLNISDDYHILFLQGGATLQFGMIPLNLLPQTQKAGYILTGSWSEKALQDAKLVGDTYVVASTKEERYKSIPGLGNLSVADHTAYVHLTSNNTIYGTQWTEFPSIKNIPLIGDMSSDLLCRPVDVNQFGLIYAGAQKNLGPSGVTLVIIHADLLERTNQALPAYLSYQTHVKNNSLYNTPPTFGIYMLQLVLQWVSDLGGLEQVHKRNLEKAALIYDEIDQSEGFYIGHSAPQNRSLMNITFTLNTPELEQKFLIEAEQAGFVGLAGHRSIRGCRASTYNAVTKDSCLALKQFMNDFKHKNKG